MCAIILSLLIIKIFIAKEYEKRYGCRKLPSIVSGTD